ncbi:MAG: DUF1700 domain-containing protein [Clostridiales bacterium]|nr:DUF1700 domain-containing protein [Clostridiales bacterium]MBR6483881.1 DUF1700 domain-containing protein [Clostridiales bacterium]
MNKKEYLEKLESELGQMSYKDVKDIMDDIGEHFDEGVAHGKTEEDIAAGLGSPEELAKSFREGGTVASVLQKKQAPVQNARQKDTTASAIFVILFNLFVAIPLWIAIVCAIFTVGAIEIGLIAGLVGLVLAIPGFGNFLAAGICLAITIALAVVFVAVLIILVTKYFVIGTGKYISWNKKIWKEGL